MKPINVGLLGIGTVGGGTFTVLKRNEEEITRRAGRPIRITTVADMNLELARKVAGDSVRLTADAFAVVTDPEIDIVVELIGGYGVARELVLAAIDNGKLVVTANKALAGGQLSGWHSMMVACKSWNGMPPRLQTVPAGRVKTFVVDIWAPFNAARRDAFSETSMRSAARRVSVAMRWSLIKPSLKAAAKTLLVSLALTLD